MFKYKSKEDYYERSSCGNFLSTIDQCPLFILMNDDDPIVGKICLGEVAKLATNETSHTAKDFIVYGMM